MIDPERIQRLAAKMSNRNDALELVRQMRCGGKKFYGGGKVYKSESEIPGIIVTPDKDYNVFLNSLPDNQRLTPESEYSTRRYWELNGRPKDFEAAKKLGMYTLDSSDGMWHANSIAWGDDGVGYFMKPKHHDTLKYELDWYNDGLVTEEGGKQRKVSGEEEDEWRKFRDNYVLDTTGDFYRYIPVKNMSNGGKLFDGGGKYYKVPTPIVDGQNAANYVEAQPNYSDGMFGDIDVSGFYDAMGKLRMPLPEMKAKEVPVRVDSTPEWYNMVPLLYDVPSGFYPGIGADTDGGLFSEEAKARRKVKQRYAESKFNDRAESNAGAKGAWQIMPITYKDYLGRGRGKEGDLYDAKFNEKIRDWVMGIIPRDLQEFWSDDDSDINKLAKLYAAYNWGAGSLRNFFRKRKNAGLSNDDPYEWVEGLNPETRRYVKYLAFDEDFDEDTGYTTRQFEDAAKARGYMAEGGKLFGEGGGKGAKSIKKKAAKVIGEAAKAAGSLHPKDILGNIVSGTYQRYPELEAYLYGPDKYYDKAEPRLMSTAASGIPMYNADIMTHLDTLYLPAAIKEQVVGKTVPALGGVFDAGNFSVRFNSDGSRAYAEDIYDFDSGLPNRYGVSGNPIYNTALGLGTSFFRSAGTPYAVSQELPVVFTDDGEYESNAGSEAADNARMMGFASGGKIHIKPENRGKFTALLKRTGKTASWYKAHGTPLQKKRATFALNAKKWKHGDGGFINKYDGETEETGLMQRVPNWVVRGQDYSEWKPSDIQEIINWGYTDPEAFFGDEGQATRDALSRAGMANSVIGDIYRNAPVELQARLGDRYMGTAQRQDEYNQGIRDYTNYVAPRLGAVMAGSLLGAEGLSVAAPWLVDVAAPAVSRFLATPTGKIMKAGFDTVGTIDGIRNLVSDNGIKKTVRLIDEGRYGRAALSGLGDVFDIMGGIGFIGDASRYASGVGRRASEAVIRMGDEAMNAGSLFSNGLNYASSLGKRGLKKLAHAISDVKKTHGTYGHSSKQFLDKNTLNYIFNPFADPNLAYRMPFNYNGTASGYGNVDQMNGVRGVVDRTDDFFGKTDPKEFGWIDKADLPEHYRKWLSDRYPRAKGVRTKKIYVEKQTAQRSVPDGMLPGDVRSLRKKSGGLRASASPFYTLDPGHYGITYTAHPDGSITAIGEDMYKYNAKDWLQNWNSILEKKNAALGIKTKKKTRFEKFLDNKYGKGYSDLNWQGKLKYHGLKYVDSHGSPIWYNWDYGQVGNVDPMYMPGYVSSVSPSVTSPVDAVKLASDNDVDKFPVFSDWLATEADAAKNAMKTATKMPADKWKDVKDKIAEQINEQMIAKYVDPITGEVHDFPDLYSKGTNPEDVELPWAYGGLLNRMSKFYNNDRSSMLDLVRKVKAGKN